MFSKVKVIKLDLPFLLEHNGNLLEYIGKSHTSNTRMAAPTNQYYQPLCTFNTKNSNTIFTHALYKLSGYTVSRGLSG